MLVGTKGPRSSGSPPGTPASGILGRRTWPTAAAGCSRPARRPAAPAATWRTSVNALIDLDGSGPPSGRTLAGSPQQLIDQLGQFTDLGFDEFILPDWNLGATVAERADKLARIKSEVFDQLPG